MKIITQLMITLVDGMVIQVDALDAKFTVIWSDGFAAQQDSVTLLDLRDLLLTGSCHALLLDGVPYNEGPPMTITIFPDSIINMVSNDTEVLAK